MRLYTAIIVIAAILLFIAVVLLSPIKIYVTFEKVGKQRTLLLKAGIWFFKINLQHPRKAKQGKEEKTEKEEQEEQEDDKKEKLSMHDIKETFDRVVNIVRYLRKKFTVSLFLMHITMGLGDAADTGIATGAAYATIYNMLGIIDRHFVLKKHDVSVTPLFNSTCFDCRFEGIIKLRLLYGLGILLKIRKDDVK